MPEIIVTSGTVPRDPTGAGGTPPVDEGEMNLVKLQPLQVAGLVPLYDCSATECRSLPDFCCDRLMVFGGDGSESESTSPPDYEHDWNTFLIDVQLYSSNPLAVVVAVLLEKCTTLDTWTTVATLTNSSLYGQYIDLNSLGSHPTYFGYRLSWPKVLYNLGAGIYRIKFTTAMRDLAGCLVSPEFDLRKFNCNIANRTVKLEAVTGGKIGSATIPGYVYDLCDIISNIGFGTKKTGWYDSIRIKGFFGFEKVKEYNEVILEYQNGQQELIRDEAIQSYTFTSGYFHKDYHDRIKVYFMMADIRWVSDYNIANSDYNVDRLEVMKTGAYEPEYKDNLHRRISKVTVEFKSAIQNVIKSLCCNRT